MNEEKVKLIKSDNSDEQYLVMLDHELGKGGFGTVYRAIDSKHRQQKLVVKVIPLQTSKREAVERELMILRELPSHPNLVRTVPLKCYSESNYYIFMEYCKDGTLLDLVRKQKNLSEKEILDIFYQVIQGYKVLYDRKILHQDLKPQNILIHSGKYKLADFGLSIFYQNYKFTNKREGTLSYIAPQKLMKLEYKGNPASDIFSIGVIFFQLVVRKHPYIKYVPGPRELKSFVSELRNAKLTLPLGFTNGHSLKFLQWFDLLLRMLAKNEVERVKFDQIYKYVQDSDTFEQTRNIQRQQSRQHTISEYNLVVSQISKVLTVPIDLAEQEEMLLRQKCQSERKIQRESQNQELLKKLFDYVVSRRILIYFLDRLARRLIVEQLTNGTRTAIYDNAIFQLMLLNKTLIHHLMHQVRYPKVFSASDWKKLKQDPQRSLILQIIAKDEGYIEDETCDFLAGQSKLTKKELQEIFDIYRKGDLVKQTQNAQQALKALYAQKCRYIEASRKQLTTLIFMEQAMNIVGKIPVCLDGWQILEQLIHQIELSSISKLRETVEKACSSHKVAFMIEIPEEEPLL